MDYKYISINRILSKIARDLGEDSIVESDIIEWTGEALEFIGAIQLHEEAVAFIEVKNHQCDLPSGTHAVIQIAKNRCWSGPKANDALCPKNVIQELSNPNPFVQGQLDCNTCIPSVNGTPVTNPDYIVLDCNGMPINDYDIAYYRPYFDLQAEYYGWCNSSMYNRCFSPVRLATNTFFNSLVCQEKDQSIYHSCTDEYTIVQGSTVRFSFREGQVAIAYVRQVLDKETGYPMIPDNISYITALTKYVTMKIMEKQFYAGREGASQRLQKAESDWQWYCKQAGNAEMMPYGVDEHQNLLDQRSYLLPRQNRYYGYFGKMARPESRKFNDPDNRNNNFVQQIKIKKNSNGNIESRVPNTPNININNQTTNISQEDNWDSTEW